MILGDPVDLEKFLIHPLLLNALKKIAISEAAVESACSTVHNRQPASLQEKTMDNELFIRYNFETIWDVAARDEKFLDLENALFEAMTPIDYIEFNICTIEQKIHNIPF